MVMNIFDMIMSVTLAMDRVEMALYAVVIAVLLVVLAIYDFRKNSRASFFIRCFLISFVFLRRHDACGVT